MRFYQFRVLLPLFSLLLLLPFALSCSADAPDSELVIESITIDGLATYIPETGETELYEKTIYETLYDGMRAMSPKIDIRSFGITQNQIKDIVTTTINMYPELYYVSNGFRYGISNGTIPYVMPEYNEMDTVKINAEIAKMNAVMNEILEGVDKLSDPVDKLLVIHDRLALYFSYDTTLTDHSAHGLLLNGRAVCQGYASAFYALATRAGITAGFVDSEAMKHIWNAFYIDGCWYHADVTWDDPVSDLYGRALHTYFLKSNEALAGHTDYTPLENDATDLDNAFWNDAQGVIYPIGDFYYYLSDEERALVKFDTETGLVTVLRSIRQAWPANTSQTSFWAALFSGLTLRNGRFYYNRGDSLYSCDLYGENTRKESLALPESLAENNSLYGFYERGGVLYFQYCDLLAPSNGGYEYTSYSSTFTIPVVDGKLYLCDERNVDGAYALTFVNESGKPVSIFQAKKTAGRISAVEYEAVETTALTVFVTAEQNVVYLLDEKLRPLYASWKRTQVE